MPFLSSSIQVTASLYIQHAYHQLMLLLVEHVVNTLKQLDSAKICTGNFDEKFISLVDEQDNVGKLIYAIKLFLACHTTSFFF